MNGMQPAGWLAIGIALGGGLGAAMDNIAIGIAIGVGLGAAMMAWQTSEQKNDDSEGPDRP
jgi:hypothetical protein